MSNNSTQILFNGENFEIFDTVKPDIIGFVLSLLLSLSCLILYIEVFENFASRLHELYTFDVLFDLKIDSKLIGIAYPILSALITFADFIPITFMIWIADSVLIAYNFYSDGNGVPLIPW